MTLISAGTADQFHIQVDWLAKARTTMSESTPPYSVWIHGPDDGSHQIVIDLYQRHLMDVKVSKTELGTHITFSRFKRIVTLCEKFIIDLEAPEVHLQDLVNQISDLQSKYDALKTEFDSLKSR